MNAPFTTEQFVDVFVRYNEGVWPAQPILNALAFVALALVISRWRYAARAVIAILGMIWLWAGVAYHWLYFTHINRAAWLFGALFAFQSTLMFRIAASGNGLGFTGGWTTRRVTGFVIILYALILYPVLGYFLGHRYPSAPTFGAPCPITLFTLGVLLLADGRHTGMLVAIPLVWAALAFTAALQFGVVEDLGLLVAAVVSAWFVFPRNKLIRRLLRPGHATRSE